MLPSIARLSLLFISAVSAAAIQKRAVIAHDAVVGFPQTVPSGTLGQLYLKYKPTLKVVNGCVPFPAVDAEGNVSYVGLLLLTVPDAKPVIRGGLAPTGDPSGGCSSSVGQVYARATTFNNQFAIMYAWFWPKDEPASGLGHRYDWESIVVWLSSESLSATLLGVAASAHGDYSTTTTPSLSGTSPLIQYFSVFHYTTLHILSVMRSEIAQIYEI